MHGEFNKVVFKVSHWHPECKTINPDVPHLIKPWTFAFNTNSLMRLGAWFRSDSFDFSRPVFPLSEGVGACRAAVLLPNNSPWGIELGGLIACNFRPSPPGCSVDVMNLTSEPGTWLPQGRWTWMSAVCRHAIPTCINAGSRRRFRWMHSW